ncbi:MAG: endonuclease/exonuclease/phosphatase family protein [Deltaproteobacteria bacterium]|nr:endonuclease/exonuclease/phosphatase family protein [Deltaproteobacteria bacterium]
MLPSVQLCTRWAFALPALLLTAACGSDPSPSDVGAPDAGPSDATTPDSGPADAGFPPLPDAGPIPEDAITAVSLNLRCLIDDWDLRRPVIARELAALAPQLIGFQEACEGDGRDNVEELRTDLEAAGPLRYTVQRRPTHRAWDRYDEGIAVLSALPVEETRQVALPSGAFPRALLLVRVTTSTGAMVFGTTHFDHMDAMVRMRQAEAVADALADFAPTGPVVLTGDFNTGPNGPVSPVLGAAGYTDGWAALFPNDPGPTFPARSPAERIDYFWLRGRQPNAVLRILVDPVAGTFGSDHLGLFGVFTRP